MQVAIDRVLLGGGGEQDEGAIERLHVLAADAKQRAQEAKARAGEVEAEPAPPLLPSTVSTKEWVLVSDP